MSQKVFPIISPANTASYNSQYSSNVGQSTSIDQPNTVSLLNNISNIGSIAQNCHELIMNHHHAATRHDQQMTQTIVALQGEIRRLTQDIGQYKDQGAKLKRIEQSLALCRSENNELVNEMEEMERKNAELEEKIANLIKSKVTGFDTNVQSLESVSAAREEQQKETSRRTGHASPQAQDNGLFIGDHEIVVDVQSPDRLQSSKKRTCGGEGLAKQRQRRAQNLNLRRVQPSQP